MEVQLTLFGAAEAPQQSALTTEDRQQKRSKREIFEDYEGFVEKFAPKLTTDDCYTPAAVYDVVLEFVRSIYDITNKTVVRPFWPGGDFTTFQYPTNAVVIDNPPFSILSGIIRFYVANNIKFFLFGPALTLFSARDCDVTYILTGASITYENGACVRTGFITNLTPGLRIWVCPRLFDALKKAQESPDKTKKKFVYPDHIVTAAILDKLAVHHTELKIRSASCYPISDSDAAKAVGRGLYGGGVSSIGQRSGRTRSGRTRSGR